MIAPRPATSLMSHPVRGFLSWVLLLGCTLPVLADDDAVQPLAVENSLRDLASKEPETVKRAMTGLLAVGTPAEDSLRAYAERYPDTPEVARASTRQWRAARRCERIVRLLQERRLRQSEGSTSSAAEPFMAMTGLPEAQARAVFEEALIPNRALMDMTTEAARMDWDALETAERDAFRERFIEAWTPVAERWQRGVRLDSFATPGQKLYPMSDVVIGDLLALLFARHHAPEPWTNDWYALASGRLANWRDFPKRDPRVSRLEVTLKTETPLASALENMVTTTARASETLPGRSAALRIALANRLKPLALDLAGMMADDDLPAYRKRVQEAPDPLNGQLIGRLQQSGPRLKVLTALKLTPGEPLVAARNNTFVGWLKMTKDGEHVTWVRDHSQAAPQPGDAVLRPPEGALLPQEMDAAKRGWFRATHTLYSYGNTMEHAMHLSQFLTVDGKVGSFSRGYRVRDFAMMGLLLMTGQPPANYPSTTTSGVCPWARRGLTLLVFGEGEQWEASRNRMNAWLAAHAEDENPIVPPEKRPSAANSRSQNIRMTPGSFRMRTQPPE